MSGFYIGVDGKARKVKGGYIGVDGKARKIKKGYIGVDGVARLCWCDVDPVFANNSWEQIAAACQTGNVPDTWAVGDQKTMTIDGTDYAIDIIGKDHDDYSDGSGKAPLTFQLHDCLRTTAAMNSTSTNITGWSGSYMRNTHLPGILSVMPVGVQTAIKEVSKLTNASGTSAAINATADKLFLLSEVELFGTISQSAAGEGHQYAYYSVGNAKGKKRNGSDIAWWQRSPRTDSEAAFCRASASGTYGNASAITESGVSFAFCF